MNCPNCGTPQARATHTFQESINGNSFTTRHRRCSNPKCVLNAGKKPIKFKTVETAIKMVEKK